MSLSRPDNAAQTRDASGSTPLLDVQGLDDVRGIALQQVGIKEVCMPIQILQKDGKIQEVAANARLSVGLPKELKGTHMSRFVMLLNDWRKNKVFSMNLREFLVDLKARLSAETAQADIGFRYFVEKAGPASGLTAPSPVDCKFSGRLTATQYQFVLGLVIPICTLCPCSKAISKYGAHNQRAELRAQIIIDSDNDHKMLWIEDLVENLEQAASCPVYPLVKRSDEKWMTERAYENPKFVEDVIRDSILILRDTHGVLGFDLEVEALESIHGHNAWAQHAENFEWVVE
jgi:GTP cyclohydrolase I